MDDLREPERELTVEERWKAIPYKVMMERLIILIDMKELRRYGV